MKAFKLKPFVSLEIWTKAYNWAKENKETLQISNENVTLFIASVKDNKSLAVNQDDQGSFDPFVASVFSMYHIHIVLLEDNDFLNGSCDCRTFFKNYVCKCIGRLQYVIGKLQYV